MRIQMTSERVRELYAMHRRFPANTIIVIIDGRWFEITFGQHASWYGTGGVHKQSVEFVLHPLFKDF